MNIYDISEKAGVSIATVSRVLNGNAKVSEKTRQKIMKVIEETGYKPNVFARGLGLNTMRTVGIMCADCSDIVLASAVYHVEQELRKNDYDTLLSCTGYDYDEKSKCMQMLLSKRVDALILVGSNFVEQDPVKNEYILEAAQTVPVMIINGYLDAPNVYCTVCDDADIMEKAMTYFVESTDKILYLYRSLSYSGRKKIEGMKKAFLKKNIDITPEHMLLFNGSIMETAEKLTQLWEAGKRYEVICTSDDELAIGALKFAKKMNLRVPEDIQIAGYNNSRISICSDPELSTVDNHLVESSVEVVNLLMKKFAGEEIAAKTVIKGELVARGTTR